MPELWKNGPRYEGAGAFPITTDSVLLADFVKPKPGRAVELCSGAGLISLLLLAREPRLSIDCAEIDEAAKSCRLFKSGNMSLGVNLQMELIRHAKATLGSGFDVEIIERHHGFISVESELGKGTTFTIHLPREHAPEAPSTTMKH